MNDADRKALKDAQEMIHDKRDHPHSGCMEKHCPEPRYCILNGCKNPVTP